MEIPTLSHPCYAAPALTPEEEKSGRSFARWVSRKNATRGIAEKLLAGGSLSEEDAAYLLKRLEKPSGFRWREARLAAWALGFAAPGSPRQMEIARTLGQELKTYHWPDLVKIYLWRMAVCAVPLTLLSTIIYVARSSLAELLPALIISFLIVCVTLALPLALLRQGWDDWTRSLLRCAAAQSLARLCLPDSAAPLATAANYRPDWVENVSNWRKISRIARKELPRVLSTLRPEHYLQLEPGIVPNLCLLINDRDEELALLALDALGKVGDGRAVAPAQRVAEKHASPRRREIARAILPTLYYRYQQENSYTHLLRASAAPVGPETLLRPASGKPDDAPQTLLRPGSFDLDFKAPDPPALPPFNAE